MIKKVGMRKILLAVGFNTPRKSLPTSCFLFKGRTRYNKLHTVRS